MDSQLITRRNALAVGAAGAAGAAAMVTGVRGVSAASGDSVVGTWVVTVSSATGQQPFTANVSLAPGGVLTNVDNQGPGNMSIGAWEHDSSSGFVATFRSFTFGTSGNFVGTAIIHVHGTVSGDDQHGTFQVDFQPATGPIQHDVDHGTFKGSRLEL